MHLHGDHSYEHSNRCVSTSLKNFRDLGNRHCPTIFVHFLARSRQIEVHWTHQDTPVYDRQLEHHLCPNHHHKLFPRRYCEIFPLSPLHSSFHQLSGENLIKDNVHYNTYPKICFILHYGMILDYLYLIL